MSQYKFKTTNIRGKQYVEVNERIKFFRQEKKYENWSIISEFTALDAEHAMCRAYIVDDKGATRAVGHAMEVRAASNINKTSYVENCETSAWGRALACLGIGIDTSIASANEVTEAIAQQEAPKSKAPAAKKAAPKKELTSKQIMDASVAYVKGAVNKQEAYESILAKYGDRLTETNKNNLKKFV